MTDKSCMPIMILVLFFSVDTVVFAAAGLFRRYMLRDLRLSVRYLVTLLTRSLGRSQYVSYSLSPLTNY